MKQLTIKKKITLWYTGIIAVVLGTILVLVLLFVDKVGISATEEEISAAVTGFSSNINFQDDSFYLDGDTEFYDDGIMFCIYDKNGRLLYGTIPTQFPEETILKSNTPRMITGSNRKWMIYDSVYTYGDDEEMWVRGITSVHSIELFMQTSEKMLLIVFPLLIILIGAIGYFMIKRALKQVDLICDEVENISNGKDLSNDCLCQKQKMNYTNCRRNLTKCLSAWNFRLRRNVNSHQTYLMNCGLPFLLSFPSVSTYWKMKTYLRKIRKRLQSS